MQEKISIKFPEDYIKEIELTENKIIIIDKNQNEKVLNFSSKKEFIEGIVTLLNELEKSLIGRNINIHKCIESDTNIKRNL